MLCIRRLSDHRRVCLSLPVGRLYFSKLNSMSCMLIFLTSDFYASPSCQNQTSSPSIASTWFLSHSFFHLTVHSASQFPPPMQCQLSRTWLSLHLRNKPWILKSTGIGSTRLFHQRPPARQFWVKLQQPKSPFSSRKLLFITQTQVDASVNRNMISFLLFFSSVATLNTVLIKSGISN
jgi:hypothetical protein